MKAKVLSDVNTDHLWMTKLIADLFFRAEHSFLSVERKDNAAICPRADPNRVWYMGEALNSQGHENSQNKYFMNPRSSYNTCPQMQWGKQVSEAPLTTLAPLYGHKDWQISMGPFKGKKKNVYIMLQDRQSKTSDFFTLLTESHPWNFSYPSCFFFPTLLSPHPPTPHHHSLFYYCIRIILCVSNGLSLCNGILFSTKKEWRSDTYYSTDAPWKHYAKRKESDAKATYFLIPFIWNTQNKQIHRDRK